ncbi:MAG TPA: hypothetical protein DCQ76_05265 [Ruminococcaceae bacterium]|nr:hypothetical protein [Oscillospiraceae bacterium]
MREKYGVSQKIFIAISWLLTAALMVTIFYLSSQVSSKSSGLSSGVIARITELFHITLSQHTVRKTAHALEYTALCFLFSFSWLSVFSFPRYALSFLSAALYASSDELHQYFVSGRACQPRDVFIDCLGAAFGLLLFFILYTAYSHIHKNKAR